MVIDTTLALDNPSHFRNSLLGRMKSLIMTIDYKIKNKTIHYNINKEAATKLLTLHPDEKRVTERAKFPYSPLGKEYE